MQTGLQIARLRGGIAAVCALAGLAALFAAASPASAQQYAPPDGIGTAAHEPEPANTDFETRCTNDAMIVMDASGSMAHLSKGGGSRIEVARSVAREIVPISAKTRSLGLLTFGPGTSDQCSNVSLKVPVQSNAASRILTEIDAITTDGGTPLSLAVETAAEALDYRHRQAVIVVLSDGDETCGRDPCAAARALKERAHDLTIHVVSMEGEPSEATTASCMANETNGLFIPTRSQQDLEDALSRTLLCPRVASLASDAAYAMASRSH